MKVGSKYPTRDGLGSGTIIHISKNIKPYPVAVEIEYKFSGIDKPFGYAMITYTMDGLNNIGSETKLDLMLKL